MATSIPFLYVSVMSPLMCQRRSLQKSEGLVSCHAETLSCCDAGKMRVEIRQSINGEHQF